MDFETCCEYRNRKMHNQTNIPQSVLAVKGPYLPGQENWMGPAAFRLVPGGRRSWAPRGRPVRWVGLQAFRLVDNWSPVVGASWAPRAMGGSVGVSPGARLVAGRGHLVGAPVRGGWLLAYTT